LAARYGGEEFSLVLTNTDATCALHLAQQLRHKVEALNLPHPLTGPGRVTISLGVAVMVNSLYDGADAMIFEADAAVYRAKRCGRNQVQMAPTPVFTECELAS
jgi:diguanylate cyclase (GGDEF)-like protein